ncbi:dihydrolipoyl dehydrogenase family protein [Mastigocladopsis repens]|uniref:dihydrolipoyl dehydrogenase family protein n=1 Tax=Mastigocladopsis repens TaxID=221287 RepID=UPI0002D92CEB|nr:NAD(P)/FAD-dependent oxidoreductase [Mastigocladopsis repens]
MTIDYDVVVIGGSLAGRYAALTASQLRAKVALVQPTTNSAFNIVNAPYEFIYQHSLSRISNFAKQLGDAALIGLQPSCAAPTEKCQISVDAPQATLYAHGVVSNLQEQHSPATLAALGVDVIIGNGQFHSSPHLSFAVNDRLLRARTYLLATGSRPAIPEIEGLQRTGFLTISQIWQSLSSPTPPKKWVIIGGVPQSIEMAQTLARFGYDVTLVVERPNILPHIDLEVAQLLCSLLEAEGVRVFTKTLVTQIRRIEDKKWLQVGDRAIETDEIVVATAQQPNIESLNLAAVDVKWDQRRLRVNDKLQTTNKRIWACGDVMGGYEFANIGNYEARIALQNALFFPRFKVNYQSIPWAVFTDPMLAQVGLTEAQAKRRFNHNEVVLLRHYFKSITAAQIRDETTGICKLIILGNGEILGASVLGTQASELINVIALAIAQKIKVNRLADLAPLYPSFSEIFEQTAQDWRQQKLSSNVAWQDYLESFFHFRRNWNF